MHYPYKTWKIFTNHYHQIYFVILSLHEEQELARGTYQLRNWNNITNNPKSLQIAEQATPFQ